MPGGKESRCSPSVPNDGYGLCIYAFRRVELPGQARGHFGIDELQRLSMTLRLVGGRLVHDL